MTLDPRRRSGVERKIWFIITKPHIFVPVNVTLSVASRDGIRIIHVEDQRLNSRQAVPFKERLVSEAKEDVSALLVDLHNVQFMDSSSLGALVTGLKALAREAPMALCGVQTRVQELLRITRMEHVFLIYPNVEEAIAALR